MCHPDDDRDPDGYAHDGAADDAEEQRERQARERASIAGEPYPELSDKEEPS